MPTLSAAGTKLTRTDKGEAVEVAVEQKEREDLAEEERDVDSMTAGTGYSFCG